MGHLKQLKYFDQLALFKLRGMNGITLKYSGPNDGKFENSGRKKLRQQIHSLNDIGYYPLKSYAYAFWNSQNNNYENICFDDLVKRYYRDKGLKQSSLQAIEDIEASVNVQVAHVLGNLGALKYVEFHSWCQRDGRNKFLNMNMKKDTIKKEELKFLSSLQYKVSKSSLVDIVSFEHDNTSFFPPVWLMVNLLTMGDTIHLIKLMSKNNRKRVADHYGMQVDQFIKWLDCLNLIRNICCHNGNLIDIKLKTMPPIPSEYNDFLNLGTNYNLPHGFAIPLIVIINFIRAINSKYNFYMLKKSTMGLVEMNEDAAQQIGFKDKKSIDTLFCK